MAAGIVEFFFEAHPSAFIGALAVGCPWIGNLDFCVLNAVPILIDYPEGEANSHNPLI
jgi:hypothetical protein